MRRHSDMSAVLVTVPPVDQEIVVSYEQACDAIQALAHYRRYDSTSNRSSWRRVTERIDPNGTNGWAFQGCELQPGAVAMVDAGSIIVAVDRYFANAKWYASDWRKGPDAGITARLYEVSENGALVLVCESTNR